jgi:hypothetical protein
MTRIVFAAALALAVALPTVQAQAQSIRTFVSTSGSDNPTCSLASPCRHFSAAVAATSAGGEVDALDAGAYGSFTINHAISIEGQGWSYVAPPSGQAAIQISAGSTDKISIRGVSLNGAGIAGAAGIQFGAGGSLTIRDSVIRNFAGEGVDFEPLSSTPTELFVSNTLFSDNGGDGIAIGEASGTGTITGVLDHVTFEHNALHGLAAVSTSAGQAINITISDCVSANNANAGILSSSTSGTAVTIMVRNCTIANNGSDGLAAANNSAATVRVTRSTITGNGVGWAALTSGVVQSYGDNNIDGNTTVNTAPPCVNGSSPCAAYK